MSPPLPPSSRCRNNFCTEEKFQQLLLAASRTRIVNNISIGAGQNAGEKEREREWESVHCFFLFLFHLAHYWAMGHMMPESSLNEKKSER